MGLRTNIFSLFYVAIILLISSGFSYAQETSKIKAQSSFEFATEKGLTKFIQALQSDGKTNEKLIQCGNNLCDLSSNYCYLRVQSQYIADKWQDTEAYVCYSSKQENENGLFLKITYYECTEKCYKIKSFFSKGDYISAVSNENPPRTYVLLRGDKDTIAYADTEKTEAFGWCEVLPVKLNNHKRCFFCTLLGVVYDGSASMTDIAFSKMAYDFMQILALGLGIWIAIQILMNVSTLTKQDIPKFINNFIKQSYKVIIACVLLMNSQQIFEYGIRPLLKAGLTLGSSLVSSDDVFSSLPYNANGEYIHQAGKEIGGLHFDYNIYNDIERYVVKVQQDLSFMQAIGAELWCIGGNIMTSSLSELIKNIGDGLEMMLMGGILVVFAFLLSIAFVFYLLDAIVQMGVAGGLAPFLIACWPFKATAKYTKVGIEMFLNSMFIFIFIGLIMSINIALIDSALSTEGGGTLKDIGDAIMNLDKNKLVELTELTGMKFLILLFCAIFGFKFVGQGTSLAGQFAKGLKGGIAPSIATMGASTAKSFALNSTKDTRKSIQDRIDRGMQKVIASPYTIPRSIYRWGKKQFAKATGEEDTANNSSGSTNLKNVANTASSNPKATPSSSQNKQRSQNQEAKNPIISEREKVASFDEQDTAQNTAEFNITEPETQEMQKQQPQTLTTQEDDAIKKQAPSKSSTNETKGAAVIHQTPSQYAGENNKTKSEDQAKQPTHTDKTQKAKNTPPRKKGKSKAKGGSSKNRQRHNHHHKRKQP